MTGIDLIGPREHEHVNFEDLSPVWQGFQFKTDFMTCMVFHLI